MFFVLQAFGLLLAGGGAGSNSAPEANAGPEQNVSTTSLVTTE